MFFLEDGKVFNARCFSVCQLAGGVMHFAKGRVYGIVPLCPSEGMVKLTSLGLEICHVWDHCMGYKIEEEAFLATDIDIYYVCVVISY